MTTPISITITATNYVALKFEAEKLVLMLSKALGQPATAPDADAAEAPKRGRPAKTEEKKETPTETDKTVTADHPKRAELLKLAKEYASKTDKAAAQKAVKLFGDNTSVVPDNQLGEAILHIKNLLKKLDTSDVSSDL